MLSRFFDETLTNLFVRDFECRVKEQGICRINSSILYDSQDPEITELRVCASDPKSEWVEVWFKDGGVCKVVRYRMSATAAGFRIADVRYSNGASLLQWLSREM